MLCKHDRQNFLPCAHSDCPQGTDKPAITLVVGLPGDRRAVTFAAAPLSPTRWVWIQGKVEPFMEVALRGGAPANTPERFLRTALGLG